LRFAALVARIHLLPLSFSVDIYAKSLGKRTSGGVFVINMISTRTGTRATIITTNLLFTRWEEVIKDKVLCSALVDRLCHKAHMVNMTGQSYRVRETQKMLKNLD